MARTKEGDRPANETEGVSNLHETAIKALDNPQFREFLAEYDDFQDLSDLNDDPSFAEKVTVRLEAFNAYQEITRIIAKNLQAQVKKEAGIVFSTEQLAQITKGARQKAIDDPDSMRGYLETARSFEKLNKDMVALEREGAALRGGGVDLKQIEAKLDEVREKRDVLGLAAQTGFVEVLKAKLDDPDEALKRSEGELRKIDISKNNNKNEREVFEGQVRFAKIWAGQICDQLTDFFGKNVFSDISVPEVAEKLEQKLKELSPEGKLDVLKNENLVNTLVSILKEDLSRAIEVKKLELDGKSQEMKIKTLTPFLKLHDSLGSPDFLKNFFGDGFEGALSRRQDELRENIALQTERKRRLDARKQAEQMGYDAPTVGEKPGSRLKFLRRLSEWEGGKQNVFEGLEGVTAEIEALEKQRAGFEAILERTRKLSEQSDQARSLLAESFVDTQVLAELTKEMARKAIQEKIKAVDQALEKGSLDIAGGKARELAGYLNQLRSVAEDAQGERGVADLDIEYIGGDQTFEVADIDINSTSGELDYSGDTLSARESDLSSVVEQRLYLVTRRKIEILVKGITDKSGSAVSFARGMERLLASDLGRFEDRAEAIGLIRDVLLVKAEQFQKGSPQEKSKALVLKAVLAKIKSS